MHAIDLNRQLTIKEYKNHDRTARRIYQGIQY